MVAAMLPSEMGIDVDANPAESQSTIHGFEEVDGNLVEGSKKSDNALSNVARKYACQATRKQ